MVDSIGTIFRQYQEWKMRPIDMHPFDFDIQISLRILNHNLLVLWQQRLVNVANDIEHRNLPAGVPWPTRNRIELGRGRLRIQALRKVFSSRIRLIEESCAKFLWDKAQANAGLVENE